MDHFIVSVHFFPNSEATSICAMVLDSLEYISHDVVVFWF